MLIIDLGLADVLFVVFRKANVKVSGVNIMLGCLGMVFVGKFMVIHSLLR